MSTNNRFQYLVDACTSQEQCAELAIMLGSHALMMQASKVADSSSPFSAEILTVLVDARATIDILKTRMKSLPKFTGGTSDAQRWQKFRNLLGYVANGSSNTVSVGQDDATNGWSVQVGKHTFHDQSLDHALDAATAFIGDTSGLV